MTPTIEEVKRVAEECGMIKYQAFDFTKELWLLAFQSEEQLQAFAQHYIEVGRKEQRTNLMQPVVVAKDGVVRFKENVLVSALLEHGQKTGFGLNELATTLFTDEYPDDWMQLAQLIGYSIGGYGNLSYVTDESYDAAAELAEAIRNNTGK